MGFPRGLTSGFQVVISMDWFKGKFTGTPIFNGKNHGFLQIFPQSNDWIIPYPIIFLGFPAPILDG